MIIGFVHVWKYTLHRKKCVFSELFSSEVIPDHAQYRECSIKQLAKVQPQKDCIVRKWSNLAQALQDRVFSKTFLSFGYQCRIIIVITKLGLVIYLFRMAIKLFSKC